MRVIVVNCSAPSYNLGSRKLAEWLRGQGHDAVHVEGDPGMFALSADLVCLSVIFSWHAPIALDIWHRVSGSSEVWCGGPGMTALGGWWKAATGNDPHRGLDERFDKHRGDFLMTFASRGCPVGCSFCIVPKIEGLTFTLDWEFRPAPLLCDNNLSALPVEFQDHIISRYRETSTRLLDANSGFEPRTFDADTFERWRGILTGAWRFAYDEQREGAEVQAMMRVLSSVPARKKRVYVLIGNEPIAECLDRARKVIEWGGEPYCQPVMKLNTLSRNDLWIRHDWTVAALRDVARFYNRFLWRSLELSEYRPRVNEPAPFARLSA